MNTNELAKKLKQISEGLEMGKELIQEDTIIAFQTSASEVVLKLDDIMQEGRRLRLGIVGEVKAGKSSFLNAMLFDGKDILPKAPTPMTAALTRISYSDMPKTRIVFYDANDWDAIRKWANEYDEKIQKMYQEYKDDAEKRMKEKSRPRVNDINGYEKEDRISMPQRIMPFDDFEKENRDKIPMECRACKEVYNMADSRLADVEKYIGKEKIIESMSDDEYRYLDMLNDYVGAEGEFTPIVKYTEIQLKNKNLEGIEVIDTPGLNDPILSRSRVTQKFLIECDAVFVLGYCGQFLGSEDMHFIMSSLPNEGINKAVLIGSKMDSAILQYPGKSRPSFKAAYLGTKRNCEEQARDNISECPVTPHNEKLLCQIKESLPPKCVSSLAYTAARQMQAGEGLGRYEEKMVENLRGRFPDFTADADTLLGLSNIPDVKEKVFEETKRQKEEIIQDRVNNLVRSQTVRFQGMLEDIAIQARSNRSDLKKYDCGQLEEKLEQMKESLDSIRIIVKNLFEKTGVDSKRTIEDMAVEIGSAMEGHRDIEVAHTTRTEHHSSTSGHLWWKKTEHWDEIIHTNTAEVGDADENLRKYMLACQKMINANFKELLRIDALRDEIKQVVMRAFEQSDKEFDEDKILIPLEIALARVTLPEFQISLEPYEEKLDGYLGGIVTNGAVKNEKIPELKRAQDRVLRQMSEDIVEMLRQQGEEIDHNLQVQAGTFVDNIVKQLEDNQKKIEGMLKDKQGSLEKIDTFLHIISDAKKILLDTGV